MSKRKASGMSVVFILICLAILARGCSYAPPSKSRFLSSFSARDAIEKSIDPGISRPRVDGGETGTNFENRWIYHRNEVADVNVSQGDETTFLQKVKTEIERQLNEAGCSIRGGGEGDSRYSISYTDGKNAGWLDLTGVRAADSYKLIISITER